MNGITLCGMWFIEDEGWVLHSHTNVVAKQSETCLACQTEIRPGQYFRRETWMTHKDKWPKQGKISRLGPLCMFCTGLREANPCLMPESMREQLLEWLDEVSLVEAEQQMGKAMLEEIIRRFGFTELLNIDVVTEERTI